VTIRSYRLRTTNCEVPVPLGIKRVDHVCMAVHKIDDQLAFFTELFGWKEAGRFRNESEGFAGVVLDVPAGDGQRQMQWEILEPLGDNSFIAKFLRERGPGLHHVTLEVENADKAAEALRGCGIDPFGGPRVSYDWKELFIHPKSSGGVLFQLFEQLDEPGFLGGPPKQ
jgi:methylmalonyl-CoA/ethylmalonyl-CoA epimerase